MNGEYIQQKEALYIGGLEADRETLIQWNSFSPSLTSAHSYLLRSTEVQLNIWKKGKL